MEHNTMATSKTATSKTAASKTATSKTGAQNNDGLEITLPDGAPSNFGNDELGQIRSLLFGQHASETLARIERVEHDLLNAIAEMQKTIDARFAEMENRIAAEVDVRTSVAANIVTRIDEEAAARRDAQIDLRTNIDRRSAQIRQDLRSATSELSERIHDVDADLRERNVNREALADLFEQAANNLTN